MEAEIAAHYLDRLKFGLAGGNGTFCSNYVRHTKNNHALISICFADRRNPYDRKRRLVVMFNKLSLSILLSAAFQADTAHYLIRPYLFLLHRLKEAPFVLESYGEAILVFIIIAPYGVILDNLATCYVCTKCNKCRSAASRCGFAVLVFYAMLSGIYIIIAGLIVFYLLDPLPFLITFAAANLLDHCSYFYFGIWNWVFVSWEGCLCLPQCSTHCCCRRNNNDDIQGFPCKLCPLLNFFPFLIILRFGKFLYFLKCFLSNPRK